MSAHERACAEIVTAGALPIVFPSHGLAALNDDALVAADERLAAGVDGLLCVELGPMFHPAGRIFSLDVFQRILTLAGSRRAQALVARPWMEWERLAVRVRERPDFELLTGNDLAIDMVVYGSDYLLGPSTFAPEAFRGS